MGVLSGDILAGGVILFVIILFCALFGTVFKKDIQEIKDENEFLNNLNVIFSRTEGKRVYLTSHELKTMYFFTLDEYDFENTEAKETYKLNYTPEGWGRHTINHNGKTYTLYEV